MSDLIKCRIATTTAARVSKTHFLGMPVWDVEEGALYIHDGTTAGGVLANSGGSGFTPQFKTQAVANADTVTLYWLPKTSGNTLVATISTGSGTFTKKLVLARETGDTSGTGVAPVAGTRFALLVKCETTSAGRVLEVRENSSSGDVLDTFSSDTEGAYTLAAEYVFTGTAWIKLWSRIHT